MRFVIICLLVFIQIAFSFDSFTPYGKIQLGAFMNDGTLDYSLYSNSRFGGKVAVNDEVNATYEVGFSSVLLLLRVAQVDAKTALGTFSFGKGYTPINFSHSAQAFGTDASLHDCGGVYTGSQIMVQVALADLKIAISDSPAVDPNTVVLQVSYELNLGVPLHFATGISDQSYAFAIGTSLRRNKNTYINASILLSKDPATIGLLTRSGLASNDEYAGMLLVIGTDTLGVPSETGLSIAKDKNTTVMAGYTQLLLEIATGVKFVPEIGYYNDTKKFYAGAKIALDF